ncbi:MAG TPA: glycosyltransferase family 4 protein [Flavobacteriales bacterium]|nr:glycosyltransferase family 4 protein [Flavobacteriales bacterium]
MSTARPLRVLVVGQTPPPFGGQAVMIEAFLQGKYERMQLFHVRLAFSDDMDSVGKFAIKKVWVLFTTIVRIYVARFRYSTHVLYYPPSGPNMVPVLRDIVLLNTVRWLFKYTVFHFHAGGVSGFIHRLPRILRRPFAMAYGEPSLSIRAATQNPQDGRFFAAKADALIHNGINDMRGSVPERTAGPGEPLVILFTGVLIPSKGVRVLLEAFREVVERGGEVRLELMGKWGDPTFQAECERFIADHGLTDRITFLGVKQGEQKFTHFAGCDIFCFPSHFEAETFGIVLIEAMMFAKPLVTTNWRGIPSVALDGINAFVVEPHDPHAVADQLLRLVHDAGLRERMGAEGRRIFEQRFTLERFQREMEDAITSVTQAN